MQGRSAGLWLIDRLLRRIVRDGELVVTGPAGWQRCYGAPSPGRPAVHIRLADAATARAIAFNPALGAGEAFMDGRLVVEAGDILALLDLVTHNLRWERGNPVRFALWRQARIAAWLDGINRARRARRNVAHHYDLDDRLYDLFLDPQRQYSCAYWAPGITTLEAAQAAKLAHIAAKLDLQPGMAVLDIGCGWGGLARYLARVAGVRVTGITLSQEQLAHARAETQRQGLAGVDFQLVDYRAVTGRYDRIVSVGMFEHVGLPHYRQFFAAVERLLAPAGVALVHSIARADGPGATDPFTAKFIFPGGYAPALSQIVPAVEQAWLWISDIEVLRLHYALTIRCWYDRCIAREAAITALYDARFFRMWMFYLASAWCAFAHDGHMNVQLQLTKRRDTLPITRDYMAAAEKRLRG